MGRVLGLDRSGMCGRRRAGAHLQDERAVTVPTSGWKLFGPNPTGPRLPGAAATRAEKIVHTRSRTITAALWTTPCI